jgi:hypothetical protein
MGLKVDLALVDHRDRNPLNNQRSNLRLASNSQNGANSLNADGSFKGVSWNDKKQKWAAYIKVNYIQTHLGYFDSEIEGATAYNAAALRIFGQFANLNEV